LRRSSTAYFRPLLWHQPAAVHKQKRAHLFGPIILNQNKVRFDFETGYDKMDDSTGGVSLGSNNLFFTLGYR